METLTYSDTSTAFGEVMAATGTMAETFRFRFSTKYQDEETGFCYYGYRFYSPTMGRFINRDPIEENGGLNLYGFVGNDPVNRWDYLGCYMSPPLAIGRIELHFQLLKLRLADELKAHCPKTGFKKWKKGYQIKEVCCKAEDCISKANEFASSYVDAVKSVYLAEFRKHNKVLGGFKGNCRVWWATVNFLNPYGNRDYGDGFFADDWKDGNGLKCDGWASLVDNLAKDVIGFKNNCWFGKKETKIDSEDGGGGHAWFRLTAPNGSQKLDPWESGGWSY